MAFLRPKSYGDCLDVLTPVPKQAAYKDSISPMCLIMYGLNDNEKDQNDEDAARDGISDRGVVSRRSIAVQRIGSVTHGTIILYLRVKRPLTVHTLFQL